MGLPACTLLHWPKRPASHRAPEGSDCLVPVNNQTISLPSENICFIHFHSSDS